MRRVIWSISLLFAAAIVFWTVEAAFVIFAPGISPFLRSLGDPKAIPGVYGYSGAARQLLKSRGYYVLGDGQLVLYDGGRAEIRGDFLEVRSSPDPKGGVRMLNIIPRGCTDVRWDIGAEDDGAAVLMVIFSNDDGVRIYSHWLATKEGSEIGFWPPSDPDVYNGLEPVMRVHALPNHNRHREKEKSD